MIFKSLKKTECLEYKKGPVRPLNFKYKGHSRPPPLKTANMWGVPKPSPGACRCPLATYIRHKMENTKIFGYEFDKRNR